MSKLLLTQSVDQAAVERGMPGFMFALLFASLREKMNLQVRADLEELANKASVAPLHGMDRPRQQMLATLLEKEGHRILSAANENHLPTLIGGLSRMLVKLADDGVTVEQNALLVALAIAGEIDDGEDWGPEYAINKSMVALDNEARRQGYFLGAATIQ